ncbi:hypothetical protein AMET1_0679 [Methanonatronarchaeum thermophilum]|uniref:Uncharacterized protein n=1 Tax=Methanonatronarchaeum thermophilum TaxID=1927129 RepID=A0A1Y3GCQ5_9EURY|nr:hypothetical protein [Methanonatronarchaeum thermophilum]OUJ19027.1 hypothetical protein AMET1_0679 [Methanonatronarchaeum thermophilum]
MVKIILKKENHTSIQDLREELELISEIKPDAILLEGEENQKRKISLVEKSLLLPFNVFSYFFGNIWVSKKPVEYMAKALDIQLYKTRENNLKLIKLMSKTTIIIYLSLILLSLFLIHLALLLPIFGTNLSIGFLLLLFSLFLIILLILIPARNSKRDKAIKNKITDIIQQENETILVVVGEDHEKEVKNLLISDPDININKEDIEVKESLSKGTKYKILDILLPLMKSLALLFILYYLNAEIILFISNIVA